MAHTARKYLYLYIDYHRVLDSGRHKLRELATFLRRLDAVGGHPYKTIISFGGQSRNEETLKELCEAGVINLLDQIVFTRQRTSGNVHPSHYREGSIHQQTYWWRKSYLPRPVTHEIVNYTIFTGGKDEYIHRGHAGRFNDAILVVDDKATTLRAVCEPGRWLQPWTMAPQPCGIEMNPWNGVFQTTRGSRYDHCSTLNDLIELIQTWSENGGKLGCRKTPPKRRRDSDAEDAQRDRKAHRSNPSHTAQIRNDASQDKEDTLRSHLAILRLRSSNPSENEILAAYSKMLTSHTNDDAERRLTEAFQFVWNNLNNYPL